MSDNPFDPVSEEKLRETLGPSYDALARVDQGLLRDLSKKITEDVTAAVMRTATLPGLSMIETSILFRDAASVAVALFAAVFSRVSDMPLNDAHKYVLNLLLATASDADKNNAAKDPAATIARLDALLKK